MSYKILIADDEPEIRSLLRLYLENEKYEIIEAEDGQQVHHVFQKPHDISVEQPIKGVADAGEGDKEENRGKYGAHNGHRAALALQRGQLGVAAFGGELSSGLGGGSSGSHRRGIGTAGIGGCAASSALFSAQQFQNDHKKADGRHTDQKYHGEDPIGQIAVVSVSPLILIV